MIRILSIVLLCLQLPADLAGKGSRAGSPQPPLHPADLGSLSDSADVDLYLLVGQSNMKGRGLIDMDPKTDKRLLFFHSEKKEWYVARDPLHARGTPDLIDGKDNAGTGPGMSFAQTLVADDPDRVIGLIPAAKGGAPIGLYAADGPLYTRSLALVEEANQQLKGKGRLKAILWLQGESDATEELYQSYEEKLLDLIDRYRTYFEDPKLPFIACTIGSFIKSPRFSKSKEINAILLSIAQKRENVACLDARDIKGHVGDSLHYNSEAQQEIGRRYATAYRKMQATGK
jgi:hypothetical protein